MNRDIVVSVIIPMYNAALYIERCLTSLQRQTHMKLQILVIDDGSTDQGPAMVETLASQDSRIVMVQQANQGVSAARNKGLSLATGEYITFVDADDEVDPRYVELLVDGCESQNLALAICGMRKLYHQESLPRWQSYHNQVSAPTDDLVVQEWLFCRSGGALFHRSLLGDLRIREDIFVGEDFLFTVQLVLKGKQFVYCDADLYGYHMLAESGSHGVYTAKKATELVAWDEALRLCREQAPELVQNMLFLRAITLAHRKLLLIRDDGAFLSDVSQRLKADWQQLDKGLAIKKKRSKKLIMLWMIKSLPRWVLAIFVRFVKL